MNRISWGDFKNILCVRLDNLGDVIMTTPAIRALKKAVPDRKITLLTSSVGKVVSEYIPEIDETIVFDTPWTKNNGNTSRESVNEIIDRLKEGKFDAAVIFTVYSQNPLPSAMICYQAGIPNIAGYCRENPYQLMTDWIPDQEPLYTIKHEVQRQMDLVRHIGAPSNDLSLSLKADKNSISKTSIKLKNLGIDPKDKIVIMHPGVSEVKRQYPLELFAETARKLTTELEYQVVLTGVASEKALTEYIRDFAGNKSFSVAGKLNMGEMIALTNISDLVISNNTGPVHIAAAVKTPVVVLYALTNPQHTPWNIPHRVLPFQVPENLRSKNIIIGYANEKCFAQVSPLPSPEDIINAVNDLISEKKQVQQSGVLSV